uniref:Uncharacterized protein LOC111132513 n=1 Tax=Crassostrea virginica TaxID=6565 RepID=A0A8B8E8N7_CRAVI|nr:uncharacterized protein LOC111132513 [Crassostrea virginica]
MDKRRIKRDFDDKAALVPENVEDRTDYPTTKLKDPTNHPDKAPRVKDFERQEALALENDEAKTPKRRQWRKNTVWTTESQTDHQAIKRKDPPNALVHPTDKEPRVKRQVQQNDINNQPRQYMPPRGRNWRYNRVWRKDMVWKKQEPTTVSGACTKSGQVSFSKDPTTVSGACTKSGQVSFSKDSTTVSNAGTKSGQVSFSKDSTTVSNAGTKSVQVSFSKDSTTVSKTGTKSGQMNFSKDSTTVSKAGTKSGQVSSSKKIVKTVDNVVPAKKETKDSLTSAVVPEKMKVKSPIETELASPKTNGDSTVHKENKSLQEETVQDVSCEKNYVLGDCISISLKRKREQSQDIPIKKRLLEAIPSRGLQPPINPRFLWNIEKELELLADLYEDLHL